MFSPVSVGLFVYLCLSARLLKKLPTDFDEFVLYQIFTDFQNCWLAMQLYVCNKVIVKHLTMHHNHVALLPCEVIVSYSNALKCGTAKRLT